MNRSLLIIFCLLLFAFPSWAFDAHKFKGERLILKQEFPSRVKSLEFNLTVPEHYHFLSEAKPYIKIYSPQNKLIVGFTLHEGLNTYKINKKITEDKAYAEIALYYCKEGKESMCLFKSVLFELTLKRNLPQQDWQLSYSIPVQDD